VLPSYYTEEPTQDGERRVRLERVGRQPDRVGALSRAGRQPSPISPPIDLLANILGDVPAGRLHRALVQQGLAPRAWGAERGMHDPGYMYFGAYLGRDGNLGARATSCSRWSRA
jgi:zinc protease